MSQDKRRGADIDWGSHDSSVIGYAIILLIGWLIWNNYDSNPVPELIEEYTTQNSQCRGGRSDQIPTWTACERRDQLVIELKEHGYCYGKLDQFEYEKTWQKCE